MKPKSISLGVTATHLVMVRPEPPGQFTAQALGLPEVRATAATQQEAIDQVRRVLQEWLAAGRLITLEIPVENPWLNLPGRIDPDDPAEQAYLEELRRHRQEDLERTLHEVDGQEQPCSNSSSTPTT